MKYTTLFPHPVAWTTSRRDAAVDERFDRLELAERAERHTVAERGLEQPLRVMQWWSTFFDWLSIKAT